MTNHDQCRNTLTPQSRKSRIAPSLVGNIRQTDNRPRAGHNAFPAECSAPLTCLEVELEVEARIVEAREDWIRIGLGLRLRIRLRGRIGLRRWFIRRTHTDLDAAYRIMTFEDTSAP